MRLGLIGLGLLGGSLLKAFRARSGDARQLREDWVVAVEPDAQTRHLVVRDGLVDVLLSEPSTQLAECDLVFLCTPVTVVERLLGPVSQCMRSGAVLSDVAGVKQAVLSRARSDVRPGVHFVGAHPMFGGERGGYAAATSELPRERSVAVCTNDADGAAVELVTSFFEALGSVVVPCSADQHDMVMAAVSHVPYLLAHALSQTATQVGPLGAVLAGRGFADSTRLSRFAFEIQGEVTRRNPHVQPVLELLISRLQKMAATLERGDAEAFRRLLDHPHE